MLLLLLAFGFLGDDTLKMVTLQDLTSQGVPSAVTFGSMTLFTSVERGTHGPGKVFFIGWPHGTEYFIKLDDGRIPARSMYVTEFRGQWVAFNFFDHRATLLHPDLRFKDLTNIAELLGLPPDDPRKVMFISPYGEHRKLVTLELGSTLELGLYEEGQPFRILTRHTVTEDTSSVTWLGLGNDIVLMEHEFGSIKLLDAQYKTQKVLWKGSPPVQSRFADTAKANGMRTREGLIYSPMVHADHAQAIFRNRYDDQGYLQTKRDIKVVTITSQGVAPTFDQRFLLGTGGGQDLLYSREEQTFYIEPHQEARK